MNAMEDDEFNEFLGLPSDVGGSTAAATEQKDLYTELYGGSGEGQEKTDNVSYGELFGRTASSSSAPFGTMELQKMESLGHEPLFPGQPVSLYWNETFDDLDVDETKIQPTVGLGSLTLAGDLQVSTPKKEEFTIVLDHGHNDPRFPAPGGVADWVVQSDHGRRDPASMRQTPGSHGSASRSSGLHGPPTSHGSQHSRNYSRGSRIPPGCNPDMEPEFPSRAAPNQALKLPGQTRVTPDEYKEFLGLGHGEIFNLDLDRVMDPPWRAPGADTSDFFNYGLDEDSWKDYCKAIESHRQEFSMKKKIQTYESSSVHYQQDPDLPPEVAAAIEAEAVHARTRTGPDVKALPIPVFQGSDDYVRNRRGRDFRRPEVRYDPEVIVELAGGVESSTGVNADYGDEYISPFGPGDKPIIQKVLDSTEETVIKSEEPVKSEGPTTKLGPDDAVMFAEDEFDQDPRSDLNLPDQSSMDPEVEQGSEMWSPHKPGPPRPDFGQMYHPYTGHHDMWHPMYPGRGWRPRGGPMPDYWSPGRGYGRMHPDGSRGRYWPPYGPRRPSRRPPPPRYYEDYRPMHHPPWTRRDDYHAPFHSTELTGEEEKSRGDRREGLLQEFDGYHRDRRRHSVEDDDRSRSYARSRTRDYDSPSRSIDRHRDRVRDYGRHRRDDDYDRHRERRRRDRSTERRRGYSKERSRGRDRDDRRSRLRESSGSESESRHRHRSKERT